MCSLEKSRNLVLIHQTLSYQFAWTLLKQWQVIHIFSKDEVESVAHLALCFAAKRFDSSLGASFKTYLFHNVRGFLQKELSQCTRQTQSEASVRGTNSVHSLFERMQASDSVEQQPLEVAFERRELAVRCREFSKTLSPVERQVTFGLYFEELSLTDLSRKLGYSRTHIARIRDRALATLSDKIGT